MGACVDAFGQAAVVAVTIDPVDSIDTFRHYSSIGCVRSFDTVSLTTEETVQSLIESGVTMMPVFTDELATIGMKFPVRPFGFGESL